ncbi:hypothetical protein Tco_0154818 [Tanacetum coccineum]
MQEHFHEMDSKSALSVIQIKFEVERTVADLTVTSSRGSSSVTSSGDETASGIVSDEEIDKQKLGKHIYSSYLQKRIQEDTTKTVLKQLKKANASLTQELKECKANLDETSMTLGEATSSRDSCLIALQTKQTKLEKYTALNDRTSDYKILQTKLNETLGLLALKDIDIQEGLKTKANEILVVKSRKRCASQKIESVNLVTI